MKIILVCGSLEPGRDGVGDYVRRLGCELIKQGNKVALLALNDRYTTTVYYGAQLMDDLEIPVLRIPSPTLKNNIPQIKAWVNDFDPDWLSLQYVMFGFHPKGLPFGLSKQLLLFSGNRRWHITFHELWLGMAAEESVKLKLWGTVQRWLVKSLIRNLKPKVIHTQTRLYQQHLHKLGFKATYLPIFSNIPVVADTVTADSNVIQLVAFGLIHTGAVIEQLANDAAHYTVKYGIPVVLVFVGHCGAEQERWALVWRAAGLRVNILGGQPADKISILLKNAAMGLSSTAMAVVEKSGSFAAMREHQLPVLNISKPWQPRGMPPQQTPPGIVVYSVGSFETILNDRKKYIGAANNATVIARQMATDLLASV